MNVLTESPISIDRISTREELDLVLRLLTDPHTPDGEAPGILATADSELVGWESALEENEEEHGDKKLMALLLQMDEPAN